MKMNIKDRYHGCIVGLAVGDALGYQVEFDRLAEINAKFPDGLTFPNDGKYSDDTQMSICIAEALIAGTDNVEKFMEALTACFISWHKAQEDPEVNRAPGNTCMAACERLAFGTPWQESGVPDGMGSGTAMRSAPIGLWYMDDITSCVEYGIASAQITHKHPSALCASVATSLLTNMAMNMVPVGVWANELTTVTAGIDTDFKEHIDLAAQLAARRAPPALALSEKFLGEAWVGFSASASALYCCMMEPNSFEKAVRMAATTNGDSDTIACIVGAWMGARHGISGIPEEWVRKVEDSSKLIQLADRLYDAKMKSKSSLKGL
jgi:ADP-ribosylglycohydrolase